MTARAADGGRRGAPPDAQATTTPAGERHHSIAAMGARAHAARAPLEIRAATLDDLETVVDLRLALLREHRASPIYGRLRADAPARARRLFAAQLASADEIVYLAIRGGEAVGILRCVHSGGSPLLHPASYGSVSSVYVAPAARRAGVLRALMRAAVAWCRERGLGEIRLHSAAGHALSNAAWDALGFEVVEHLRMMPID